MRALLMGVLVLALAACGGSGSSPSGGRSGAFCQRVEACNALNGASVSECSGLVDQCLDQLLPGARQDWNNDMDQCLQQQTCGHFISCWRTIPDC